MTTEIPTIPTQPVVVPNGAQPTSAPDEATRAAGRKQSLIDNVRRERLTENVAPPLAVAAPEPEAYGVWIVGTGWLGKSNRQIGDDTTVFSSLFLEVAQSAAILVNMGRQTKIAFALLMDKSLVLLEAQILAMEKSAGDGTEFARREAARMASEQAAARTVREEEARAARLAEWRSI